MGKLAIVRCLQVGSLFLLSLAGSFAYAQTPVAEQALALAHDDPQLKWGPCPPFLPKGCGIAVLHGAVTLAGGAFDDSSNCQPSRLSLFIGILRRSAWCW